VEIQTPENALALVASIFLDNGKNYPASPSSFSLLKGMDQTNIITCINNHTTSHKTFKVYIMLIESQSIN
jgi:hypothetical protein